MQKLLKKEEFKAWGRDTQAKVCDFYLLSYMIQCNQFNTIICKASLPYQTLQLGSRLIELLIESAFIQPPVSQSADSPPDVRPAFWHGFKPVAKTPG